MAESIENNPLISIIIGENENRIQVNTIKTNSQFICYDIKMVCVMSPKEGAYSGSVVEEFMTIESNLENITDNSEKIKYLIAVKSDLICIMDYSGFKDKYRDSLLYNKKQNICALIDNKIEEIKTLIYLETSTESTGLSEKKAKSIGTLIGSIIGWAAKIYSGCYLGWMIYQWIYI